MKTILLTAVIFVLPIVSFGQTETNQKLGSGDEIINLETKVVQSVNTSNDSPQATVRRSSGFVNQAERQIIEIKVDASKTRTSVKPVAVIAAESEIRVEKSESIVPERKEN
ncbi:MAG: hypothetical protein K9G41_05920 [Flavobacteriales bacterium]|nr:hypothetical protein [Flavobacteriales bacterium]